MLLLSLLASCSTGEGAEGGRAHFSIVCNVVLSRGIILNIFTSCDPCRLLPNPLFSNALSLLIPSSISKNHANFSLPFPYLSPSPPCTTGVSQLLKNAVSRESDSALSPNHFGFPKPSRIMSNMGEMLRYETCYT